ncbi:PucR C-terminal helix-turn-helix domain-containing protein [Sporobacter termitidis DSM 10068]|uniref:PucR C-terminal helix-turn-helix domain-containing protein n=1 Tax=Sporobacter termitidis DSM 10068 TaxID=1123282 RepID=A0A1M5WGN7_9FIRM|nr:helix-turn-helix domain-containing protein [Sporobacter termitidis]SHH86662.1 PucR C-terminal helix-turn-helix domain-containing protein [Sporobacter termitidis DSM 10068]
MKISAELLRKSLAPKYFFEISGPVGIELLLERTLFLSKHVDLAEHCIYLTEGAGAAIKQPARTESVLLCVGNPPESFADYFETIFIFAPDISMLELHNEIQGIFAFYEKWDTTLQNILNSGGGVQDMIDCSAEIFENPMLLHNKSFGIIACSPAYKDYPEAQNATAGGTLINIDLETTKRDEEFNRTYSAVRASIFPAHLTGVRTLYMNLFFQGRYEYRILVIESSKEIGIGEGPLLEQLAYYMKLAIVADKTEETAEVMTLQHVLKSILNGTFSDPYYIELRLNEYDWYRQQTYFCIKLMVDILDVQNHTLSLLCNNIVTLMPGACAFDYDNSIVVYVNLDLFRGSIGDAVNGITYYLRDNNLKAGISNQFTGLNELKLYYRQAEIALDVGLRNKPHIWIHRFRDITELFLLQICTSQLPARMVCAPELLALEKYDKEHDTEYYHTLMVYLKNNLRHVQTARELFIHRSTFLYRLDRIREITGLELENCGRQWYLLLSFRLLGQNGRE